MSRSLRRSPLNVVAVIADLLSVLSHNPDDTA